MSRHEFMLVIASVLQNTAKSAVRFWVQIPVGVMKVTEYYLIENAFHISTQPEVECLQRLEANLGLNMRAPLRESFNR